VSDCEKLFKFKTRVCCRRAIIRTVTPWFRPRIVEFSSYRRFLRFNTANCQYIVASQAITIIIALLMSVTALTRQHIIISMVLNPLTPNDHYIGRTAPLTSKRCILFIYSTNIGTEYFKNGIYSPLLFSSKCSFFHNSSVFGSCIIHILYTGVLQLKKIIPAPKG